MQERVECIVELVKRQLELNASKTKFAIFTAKNKTTQEISPMFGTSVIERVSRFLGVQFHENLN